MHVDPEDRLSPVTYRESRSGAWWVVVILLGVLFGNILSFGAYRLYVAWELRQFEITFRKASEEQQAILRENARAIESKNRRNQEVRSQLRQTCQFWQTQVAQDDNPKYRAYRDAACAKVR